MYVRKNSATFHLIPLLTRVCKKVLSVHKRKTWLDQNLVQHPKTEVSKCNYYSFKIFPRFWLVKTTRAIHHNQLLFTKFGKNSVLLNLWCQKCSPLQIIELFDVKLVIDLLQLTHGLLNQTSIACQGFDGAEEIFVISLFIFYEAFYWVFIPAQLSCQTPEWFLVLWLGCLLKVVTNTILPQLLEKKWRTLLYCIQQNPGNI